MRHLPLWAYKPKHTKTVIATSRGWEVKDTGEILTRVKGLDEKLKDLFSESDNLRKDVYSEETPKEEKKETEQPPAQEKPVDTPAKPAKRRGRPPKNKPKTETE